MAKFWIQRPADKDGNSSYPPAVIEAEEEWDESLGWTQLRVIAPPLDQFPWPDVSRDHHAPWVEHEGPARMLPREEWEHALREKGLWPEGDAPGPAESRLRTGEDVLSLMVAVTVESLRRLMRERPVDLHEAVEKARNPGHRFWGQSGERLAADGLVNSDGTMHEQIRSIILAAVEGEGLQLRLVNPR